MRKICILAYWYPPLQAVGSLRAESFAKYAKQNGFEPFIISVKPNQMCTPDAPEISDTEKVYRISGFDLNFLLRNLLKKVFNRKRGPSKDQYQANINSNNKVIQFIKKCLYFIYRKCLCFPDTHFYWFSRSKKQFLEIIEREKPDFILTTAFPVSSFYFGRYLKKKHPEIKWIADYRDLWSQHQWYERPWPLNIIERARERQVLKSADLIMTTSKEFQKKLEVLHVDRSMIPIVYNGFDEDLNENEVETEKFIISYTGVLYEQQRPDIFLEAVKNLAIDKQVDINKFQIDFYGKMPAYLPSLLESYGLTTVTKLHGVIPREEVIKRQRASSVLLLIRWDDGPLHVKVFEYLSARVPVLALVNGESEIAELVSKTSSGLVCQEVQQVQSFLTDEYQKWTLHNMNRLVEKSDEVLFYSRESQAQQLYKFISKISE